MTHLNDTNHKIISDNTNINKTSVAHFPGQRSLQQIAALKVSGIADYPVHVCVAGACLTILVMYIGLLNGFQSKPFNVRSKVQ